MVIEAEVEEFNLRLTNSAPELYRIVAFFLEHMDTKHVMVPRSNTRMPDGDHETVWRAMHKVITTIKGEDEVTFEEHRKEQP